METNTSNPSPSPTPGRYTMRETLRSGKPRPKQRPRSAERPGASKAAAAAWTARDIRPSIDCSPRASTSSPSTVLPQPFVAGDTSSPSPEMQSRTLRPKPSPKTSTVSTSFNPRLTPESSRSPARPQASPVRHQYDDRRRPSAYGVASGSSDGDGNSTARSRGGQKSKGKVAAGHSSSQESDGHSTDEMQSTPKQVLQRLPPGVDRNAAKQILHEIVVRGDEVHWSEVAGLETAKEALLETVVYPLRRPDLFTGLREPPKGMLLFGPPGTGKTMLARAAATESQCTFFSIKASSLTSKYLGESEKLVRALFAVARLLAPSIIFVDEIDSILGQRSGSGDNEATIRIKTEFLIQWSDLQRAAAGRDATATKMVLVLAATNLPWALDEAARRRFENRLYIALPDATTRAAHLRTLLEHQNHQLSADDIEVLAFMTEGYSGSDVTALAKHAAVAPLRSLGKAMLHTSITVDNIRPIEMADFEASLATKRPSVDGESVKAHEEWARKFGERG